MDRFEGERAMLASKEPTLTKTLFLVLCTHLDARTGTIPPQHQPSLSRLSRLGSMCRSSVRNHLNRLEDGGWITSTAPDIEAQRRGARTSYVLHLPGSADHRAAKSAQKPADRRRARRARAQMFQQRSSARKTPDWRAAPDATFPAEPAARRSGSISPAIAAAIERARVADKAPPKPTPIPPAICMRCGAGLDYCQCEDR